MIPPTADEVVTPEALLAQAERLWGIRPGPRRHLRDDEQLIGEIPSGPGEVITLSRKLKTGRAPMFRFRYWRVQADGSRVPLTFGMNLTGGLLPLLAGLLAAAMKNEIELPRSPGRR